MNLNLTEDEQIVCLICGQTSHTNYRPYQRSSLGVLSLNVKIDNLRLSIFRMFCCIKPDDINYDSVKYTLEMQFEQSLRTLTNLINNRDSNFPHSTKTISNYLGLIGKKIVVYIHSNFPNKIDFILDGVIIPVNTIKHNIIIKCNLMDKQPDNDIECCICLENKEYKLTCKLNCYHPFCLHCVCKLIISHNDNINKPINCPMCRTEITTVYCNSEEQVKLLKQIV